MLKSLTFMPKTKTKTKNNSTELKNISYELFIGALSVISIFNIVLGFFVKNPQINGVLIIINIVLTVIFFSDFIYRLYTANSKKDYFFRQYGWADFLASMPIEQMKILRIFRLFRVYRIMNVLGAKRIISEFIHARGGSALLTILLIAFLVFEFGGMFILYVEKDSPDANITTASDALWWIMATVTTVGYGDVYPVTNAGRIVGVMVMITGIGLFGTLTGFLANAFLAPKEK